MAAAAWAGDTRWQLQQQGAEYWAGVQAATAAYDPQWAEAAASSAGRKNNRQKGAAVKGYPAAAKSPPLATAPPVSAVQSLGLAPPPGWFGGSQVTAAAQRPLAMPQGRDRFQNGQFRPHRLCNHFTQQGWCRKEDQCTFAHGLQELHQDVQSKLASPLPPGMLAQPSSAIPGPGMLMQADAAEFRPQTVSVLDPLNPMKIATTSLGQYVLGADTRPATIGAGFAFNTSAAPFSVTTFSADAKPFVPRTEGAGLGKIDESGNGSLEPLTLPLESRSAQGEAGPASPTLPGVSRRQAPAPLSDFAAEQRPALVLQSPTASGMVMGSPTASSMIAAGRVASVAMSPTGRTLAMSPKASGSPTSNLFAMASSVAMASLVTPTSPPAQGLRSPTASACFAPMGSPTGRSAVMWPATSPKSQAMAQSAMWGSKVMTPTATLFDRETLLRGRNVAKRIEVGPPGLGMCAPTPTSAARGFGFQFPQPGYVKTLPVKAARQIK